MTFAEAADHIMEHNLGERSEARIAKADVKEFIYWASLEIAQGLGFPRKSATTAVLADATSAALESDVWRLDPTTVSLGDIPLRPGAFDEVLLHQQRATGMPTAFYWNPAAVGGSNLIQFGPALSQGANLKYEYIAELYGGEKPAYLVTNEDSDIWGTALAASLYGTPVFAEWHEQTVIPLAAAKSLNRMKLYSEADRYYGIASRGVAEMAEFLGVPLPAAFGGQGVAA